MPEYRPLVRVNGRTKELPADGTLPGTSSAPPENIDGGNAASVAASNVDGGSA